MMNPQTLMNIVRKWQENGVFKDGKGKLAEKIAYKELKKAQTSARQKKNLNTL